MWIFADSFLSIVRDESNKKNLLVRSRFPRDIGRIFPTARVRQTPKFDYPFRASIDEDVVADGIARRIRAIDYGNFKASIVDGKRAAVYHAVWDIMRRAQAWNYEK
ncbi:MAG: hypothetical protein A3G34_07985 [Candidatus Lindowbacteria bacterium RIFCSPLOWO2_12_FULL_62_27]|nr:MAG: hypothetical protein A3G34_07985 [Candidatus Lindowbacteria bacterium RIFCSPLOWO2_12_FULL_62_27]OGH63594.1 MAG: hypothetical protein A3I06_14010 [Candidatus Lindowbacteria bacterium RIFCSPLOWO2_02_FULL_62_12]